MTVSPNLDLLQRQRTFSIDETREQLQQGRPVQRMAVAAGSVDYKSMMYGDDAAAAEAHHSGSISSSNQPSKSQPAQKGPSSWAAIAANGASDVLPPKTSTALGVAAVAAKPSAQSVAVVVGTTVDALKSNADSKKLVKGSRDGSKDASGKGKSSTSSVEKKTGRDGRDGRGREKDAKKERGSISKVS